MTTERSEAAKGRQKKTDHAQWEGTGTEGRIDDRIKRWPEKRTFELGLECK